MNKDIGVSPGSARGRVHLFQQLAGYWESHLHLFPLPKAVWKGLPSRLTHRGLEFPTPPLAPHFSRSLLPGPGWRGWKCLLRAGQELPLSCFIARLLLFLSPPCFCGQPAFAALVGNTVFVRTVRIVMFLVSFKVIPLARVQLLTL